MMSLKKYLLPIIFLVVFIAGCGSSNASIQTSNSAFNGSTSSQTVKTATAAVNPTEILDSIRDKTRTGVYTVEIKLDQKYAIAEPTSLDGKYRFFNGWVTDFKYTQKGNNINIEIVKEMAINYSAASGNNIYEKGWYPTDYRIPRVSIYNDSRKQEAAIGLTEETPNNSSTGLQKPSDVVIQNTRGSRFSDMVQVALARFIPDFDAVTNKGNQSSSSLRPSVNKQDSSLVFSSQTDPYYKTQVDGDTKFILECSGPNGMPSKVIKKVDDYGANKGGSFTIAEFAYTNIDNVPDTMFEVPTGADTSLPNGTSSPSSYFSSLDEVFPSLFSSR